MKIAIQHYQKAVQGLSRPLRLCVLADFHNGNAREVFEATKHTAPNLVLLPGDFLDREDRVEQGFALLSLCASRYPTYCSLGNHETRARLSDMIVRVANTGAVLLDNALVHFGELTLGGLTTGYAPGMKQGRWMKTPPPDRRFLSEFAKEEGVRVLLCHHPEYYLPYIREKDIPLILSGHAHGGQWELGGRAIFAPGQGLFPRFTAGMYEDRLVVSRGLGGGPALVPRINNPREIVVIDLWPVENA